MYESNALIDVILEDFYLFKYNPKKLLSQDRSIKNTHAFQYKDHLPLQKKLPHPVFLKKPKLQSQTNRSFIEKVIISYQGRLKHWLIDYRLYDIMFLLCAKSIKFKDPKDHPFDFINFQKFFIELIKTFLDVSINEESIEKYKRKLIVKCIEIRSFNDGYFDFSDPNKPHTDDDLWPINFDLLIENIRSLNKTNKIIKILKRFHLLPKFIKNKYFIFLDNLKDLQYCLTNNFIYDICLMIYFYQLWIEHKTRYLLIMSGDDHIKFFRRFFLTNLSYTYSCISLSLIDQDLISNTSKRLIKIPKLQRPIEEQKTQYQKYLNRIYV
jgi:hypothetical protein